MQRTNTGKIETSIHPCLHHGTPREGQAMERHHLPLDARGRRARPPGLLAGAACAVARARPVARHGGVA